MLGHQLPTLYPRGCWNPVFIENCYCKISIFLDRNQVRMIRRWGENVSESGAPRVLEIMWALEISDQVIPTFDQRLMTPALSSFSYPSACAMECGSERSLKCDAPWTVPWTAAVRPHWPWTAPSASIFTRPPIIFRWARSNGVSSTRCSPRFTNIPAWSPVLLWPTTWVPVCDWPGGWSTRSHLITWTWTLIWVRFGLSLLFAQKFLIDKFSNTESGFLRPEKHERHPQADRRSDLIKAFLWPALMQNNQCAFKAVVATWGSSLS